MRTILSDVEADQILNPFYNTLANSVDKAVKDYNSYSNFVNQQLSIRQKLVPATKSITLWNFIINHVEADFINYQGVRSIVYKRVFGLLIYDSIFVRFKKIDRKGNSFNINTDNNTQFNTQGELDNFPEKPTLLKLGWLLNATNTDIKDLFIVCPRSAKKIYWKIDIYEKIKPLYLFPPTDQEVSPEIDKLLKISSKLKQEKLYGNT